MLSPCLSSAFLFSFSFRLFFIPSGPRGVIFLTGPPCLPRPSPLLLLPLSGVLSPWGFCMRIIFLGPSEAFLSLSHAYATHFCFFLRASAVKMVRRPSLPPREAETLWSVTAVRPRSLFVPRRVIAHLHLGAPAFSLGERHQLPWPLTLKK